MKSIVYVTFDSEVEARDVAKTVVRERLAACANMVPGMTSFYWWQNNLEEGQEIIVLFKTRKSLVEQLIHRIKELHSYEVPCIVALDMSGGNPDFLNWIEEETALQENS